MSDARETFASLCKQLWGAGITDNTKSFHLVSRPADGDKLFLDVGKVPEVASVKLNGEDLAVQWTKPMRVEITGAVKIGENELQITVVSLWPNRLRADELLPRSERLTETNIHKFGAATTVLPSGLLGPSGMKTLTFGKQV